MRQWEARDPIIRLERHLAHKGLLSEAEAGTIREQALASARASFEEVEQAPDTTLEDTFAYLYSELPDLLAEQLRRRKA